MIAVDFKGETAIPGSALNTAVDNLYESCLGSPISQRYGGRKTNTMNGLG